MCPLNMEAEKEKRKKVFRLLDCRALLLELNREREGHFCW